MSHFRNTPQKKDIVKEYNFFIMSLIYKLLHQFYNF